MPFVGKSTFQLAMDPTVTHDLIRLAFHPFLLCVWLLKTLDLHQVQVHLFRRRSGVSQLPIKDPAVNILCSVSHTISVATPQPSVVVETQLWMIHT